MIAKILLPIVFIVLLTACYLDRVYWRHGRRWKRVVGWGTTAVAMYATIAQSLTRDYFPDDIDCLFLYLHLLCVVIVPTVIYTFCLFVARLLRHQRHGEVAGCLLAVLSASVYLYGTFVGSEVIETTQFRYAHRAVPKAFQGYKIVQFSDAHVGSYTGSREAVLRDAVKRINAQHADLVVFTGDLQNKRAEEIEAHRQLLSSIQAKDGVVAVLGNHDYGEYLGGTKVEKDAACARTCEAFRQLGWTLLRNEHLVIRRGNDSIVIAGMENDGEGRFPCLGNVTKTMEGVSPGAFVIMLEHDPTSWRRKILPFSHAQLTLSGHTHGGQMSLFGLSPAAMRYKEYSGRYDEYGRTLYVSKGLGGVIPFRLGAPGEIVVVTLAIDH